VSDAGWFYCPTCQEQVDAEIVDGCRHWECPKLNRVVDTGDDLHQILGEALAAVSTPSHPGEAK
jgi:hypothetical protein